MKLLGDKGFDIPSRTDFVNALRPLLNELGTDPRFAIIVFMLDETTLSRGACSPSGVYPALSWSTMVVFDKMDDAVSSIYNGNCWIL